ncbi:MAG: hypothetical protein U0228_38295 [Myxococcaceae bacterium]
MGALITFDPLRITRTDGPEVRAERPDTAAFYEAASMYRLAIDPARPLYPLGESVTFPRRAPKVVKLAAGLYQVVIMPRRLAPARGQPTPPPAALEPVTAWVDVKNGEAEQVSEAEALKRLGAVERLNELGLEDAAVSLQLGDLTNARYQWLRLREGLS